MSTNSYIAVQCDDGIRSVYSHWDGGTEHNGKILHEHYTDFLKVCTLINHGSISLLQPNIDPTGPHDFDKPEDGVCIFYARDRGDQDCEFEMFAHAADLTDAARESGIPWVYLYANGYWTTFKVID
jgi:hypothetical protein